MPFLPRANILFLSVGLFYLAASSDLIAQETFIFERASFAGFVTEEVLTEIETLERSFEHPISDTLVVGQILFGSRYVQDHTTLLAELSEDATRSNDIVGALTRAYDRMSAIEKRAVDHARAIALGRQIYVENALALDERYNSGRLARAPEEIKVQSAQRSFDHTFAATLRSNLEALSAESLRDIAYYSRDFVEVYLMNPEFAADFPQENLEIALRTAELVAEEEASRARTAELAAEEGRLAAEGRTYREETREIFRVRTHNQ